MSWFAEEVKRAAKNGRGGLDHYQVSVVFEDYWDEDIREIILANAAKGQAEFVIDEQVEISRLKKFVADLNKKYAGFVFSLNTMEIKPKISITWILN